MWARILIQIKMIYFPYNFHIQNTINHTLSTDMNTYNEPITFKMPFKINIYHTSYSPTIKISFKPLTLTTKNHITNGYIPYMSINDPRHSQK